MFQHLLIVKLLYLFVISNFLFLHTTCAHKTNNEKDKDVKRYAYIERYKYLAISEMQRSGIPASIKLAQALLESASGESRLAVEGNNHFGIKCKKGWKGDTIRITDDAPLECFRKYPSVEASYTDHSDFLRFRKYYRKLFSLDKKDYVAWAYELKRSGYATNPKYAESLVRLIDKYQLFLYDQEQTQDILVQNPNPILLTPHRTVSTQQKHTRREQRQRKEGAYHIPYKRFTPQTNGGIDDAIPQVGVSRSYTKSRYQQPRSTPISRPRSTSVSHAAKTYAPKTIIPKTRNNNKPKATVPTEVAKTYTPTPKEVDKKIEEPVNVNKPETETAQIDAEEAKKQLAEPKATITSNANTPEQETNYNKNKTYENVPLSINSLEVNERAAVRANKPMTPSYISHRYKIPLRKILRFNDLKAGQQIDAFLPIFLEPKKRKGPAGILLHIVEQGQNMFDIAQLYGIRLHALYKRNGMEMGTEPIAGEEIYLRDKSPKKPILRW